VCVCACVYVWCPHAEPRNLWLEVQDY